MTDVRMGLAQLLEKGSDADLLREMVGYVAQRLMDLDVEGVCGAAHGERSGERDDAPHALLACNAPLLAKDSRLQKAASGLPHVR